MVCKSVLARINEFSLSDQQRNLLKLKNLASLREFVRDELHIPSLKGKKRSWRKLEVVWSNQGFGRPSLDSFCPALWRVGLSMLCICLGERSRTSLQLVILRDLPHTYSCTRLHSKEKNKSGKKKGLCQFWTLGSLNFIESNHVNVWSTNLLLLFLVFISFILYYFISLFSFSILWQTKHDG